MFYKEGSALWRKTAWWVKGEGRVEGRKGMKATEGETKLRVQNEGHMGQAVTLIIPTDLQGGKGGYTLR